VSFRAKQKCEPASILAKSRNLLLPRRLACIRFRATALECLFLLLLQIPASAQHKNAEPQKISEARHDFPLDNFYDVPNPLPLGKPGDLIRSEEFDEYALPPEVLALRILYHSRSANGNDVAVSGIVLYPDKEAPRTGWPVIAWAHPLNGVARQCAPSLARNLQHGPYLSMYVNLGYAVVATDYAGLGTGFRNAFSDVQSNAKDVIYSIPAARAAVPQLNSRWIAVGIGEGGPAVAGAAELESDMHDSGYLGSIVISGLDDLRDRYQPSGSREFETPIFLAYGIQTVYPQFNVKDILTAKGQSLYTQIEKSCIDPGRQSPTEILNPGWASNSFVKQYFARNVPGKQPVKGPMLIISSALDAGIPISRTAQVISRMCKQGDQIQFERYPESEPSSLFGDSVGAQISWIAARFAGHPAANNCSLQP
jgi:Secretory lipase